MLSFPNNQDSEHVRSASSVLVNTSIGIQTDHPSVNSLGKRLIDIIGSLVGLIVLGLLIVPIGFLIKLDSPGPIFYCQTRYGLKGRPFTIWKFRSMVQNADELKATVTNEAQGLIFKNATDPRITRIGRFLRKTSLDEFPQFLNVLKGEMSLVGTRPPTGDEVSLYSPHHWRRLDVKPGLTGQWQVNGRSVVKDFEEVVRLDLDYQRAWSLWHDCNLIVKTFFVLFDKTGAY